MRAYFDNQIYIILNIILSTKYAVCARNYASKTVAWKIMYTFSSEAYFVNVLRSVDCFDARHNR